MWCVCLAHTYQFYFRGLIIIYKKECNDFCCIKTKLHSTGKKSYYYFLTLKEKIVIKLLNKLIEESQIAVYNYQVVLLSLPTVQAC